MAAILAVSTMQETDTVEAADQPVQTADALHGVRVIEMGQLIAGPFCGKTLGEFGAEVIKIEAPADRSQPGSTGGDPLRNWRLIKEGTSVWWQVQSRNKRSVALDLRQKEGQDVYKRQVHVLRRKCAGRGH